MSELDLPAQRASSTPRGVRLGIIGTGWVGLTRARTAASDGRVTELHLADLKSETVRLAAGETNATSFTCDYKELIDADAVDALIVSTAPEDTHYPIARDCLAAGKHVLLEKPMALALDEADDLIEVAEATGATFTVGYSQRFQPKFAFVKEQFDSGALGKLTTILISRHITRELGAKIASRGPLGPVQMEATHDIDLALWWLYPRRPARIYAQSATGIMLDRYGLPDCAWIMITMEDGTVVTIGADWSLPTESPGYSSVMAEVVGTRGGVFVDESHRDLLLTTAQGGIVRPLSTMPGEQVGSVYRGPMEAETKHFIECIAVGRAPVVTARQARLVMEATLAADLSAARNEPISLDAPAPGTAETDEAAV
ncbi:MAG: Gfo/Idh/MocA family oxidoreductase [bacterium]|jgi:predicted dehydrogenase|nr:Gfo/Idh/MocA family oxidoreductase [bacterium]